MRKTTGKLRQMTTSYRAEIDGLRAIAVIGVIFFHADFESFSGGYIGVDVFFVISGFLITRIIMEDLKANSFTLSRFYERRARRILPPLLLVAALSIPFACLLLSPRDLKDFSQSLVALSFFSSNILFWHESNYFDTFSELKPLIHTWSLAVEEQFYILFPILLLLLSKGISRLIPAMLWSIFLVSFILATRLAMTSPDAAFIFFRREPGKLFLAPYAHTTCSIKTRREYRLGLDLFSPCQLYFC